MKRKEKETSIQSLLNMLLLICLVPLALLLVWLMVLMTQFSGRYDDIVENITQANAYNIEFKEDIDYMMYIMVANSERADELIDTQEPQRLIEEAREVFTGLYENSDSDSYGRQRLERILKCLDSLEDQVSELKEDAQISSLYDQNMEKLELDIRVLTELIQEQIQKYIYYETTNLESLREQISADVQTTIRWSIVIFIAILVCASVVSRRTMRQISRPIRNLCTVTQQASRGDFSVRIEEHCNSEIEELNVSFNRMIEQIGDLVENIRTEQENLRATELKLLQAQINPHFLYNTLDTIVWLAEAGRNEEVVRMVTSLSDFFRTTLNNGMDDYAIRDEETHIRSYLEIQQFRYRDIMDYEIRFSEEIGDYIILKLTLQPLVENALYHGIKNKRGKGHILVTGQKTGEDIVFHVKDNGIGMTAEKLKEVRAAILPHADRDEETKGGFGLYNVASRLRLNYGREYGISFDSTYGEGTDVTVRIPSVKKQTSRAKYSTALPMHGEEEPEE